MKDIIYNFSFYAKKRYIVRPIAKINTHNLKTIGWCAKINMREKVFRRTKQKYFFYICRTIVLSDY